MVAPLITGLSRISSELGSYPLDAEEQAGGVQAFSALMYQYGAQMDARVLVAMWIAGVTTPRVIHLLKERNKAKEAKVAKLAEGSTEAKRLTITEAA